MQARGEGSSSNQLIERRQLPLQFLWLRHQIICSCCGKWGGLIREEGGVHLPYLYFAHIPLSSTFVFGMRGLSIPLPRHCFHLFYMQQEWQVGGGVMIAPVSPPVQFFRLSKRRKVEGRQERRKLWHICRSFRERILLSWQRPNGKHPVGKKALMIRKILGIFLKKCKLVLLRKSPAELILPGNFFDGRIFRATRHIAQVFQVER